LAKGKYGIESDMDIPIYYKSRTNILEWENKEAYYESEKYYLA
jgi:hypothetical protein